MTPPPEPAKRSSAFGTTHWSVVLMARCDDTPGGRAALGSLCQTYWYPLYAYIRRRGHSSHDAQDLTQAFFAQLLERQSLAAVHRERGRFRAFLLTSLNHFLANEREKARTQRRGGGCQIVSLDWAAAENRFDLEPADQSTPGNFFERQWALTLLSEVLDHLEAEYQEEGKSELFTALKQTLAGTRETPPYDQLAACLNLNEGTIKTAVHRLRHRYRDLIRAEIAKTLDRPQDIEDELRHLFNALTKK